MLFNKVEQKHFLPSSILKQALRLELGFSGMLVWVCPVTAPPEQSSGALACAGAGRAPEGLGPRSPQSAARTLPSSLRASFLPSTLYHHTLDVGKGGAALQEMAEGELSRTLTPNQLSCPS